jgi:hypothetical protein
MSDTAVFRHADSGCLSAKMPNNRHIMAPQRPHRRFTPSRPCPICHGHEGGARGRGVRCFGYLDSRGEYARCTREEHAGSLPRNRDGTYSHRLADGTCRCGLVHGAAPDTAGHARPAAGTFRRPGQRFRSNFTLAAFLRKRYGEGTAITPWVYRGSDGSEAFRVLRIDYRAPDGSKAKSYRPCHRADDGRWLLSRPNGPLPLYNLPDIAAAPPEATVTLLEGEKCADLATALGLVPATTSAHGSRATWLTDWSPLAGRSVAILRDQDADGEGYATQAAALLAALDPPARVRILSLPGLSDGEDIEQWIARRRDDGLSDAGLLAELAALIAASP